MRTKFVASSIVLGLGLTMTVLWLLGGQVAPGVVAAPAGELHVCLSGCPFDHVQAAVDAAGEGDLIKIAEGTYTDVSTRQGITQVVYLSKTLTLQGGVHLQ